MEGTQSWPCPLCPQAVVPKVAEVEPVRAEARPVVKPCCWEGLRDNLDVNQRGSP